MGKKKKASPSTVQESASATMVEGSMEVDSMTAAEPAPQNTFTAASGKFFATARCDYPEAEDFTEEFTCDVVGAAEGDLLEVLAIHKDWAYGRRFKPLQKHKSEGVFRLEWVCGVKLVIEAGKRKPVEVDICSEEYGFRGPKPNDSAGKLQAKRYDKRIADAAEIWDRLEAKAATADVIAEQEAAAAAARVAQQLEKEDSEAHSRRKMEEARQEAILAEVRRRKAEAEYVKKQAAVQAEAAERARLAEEEAMRLELLAQRRAQQEAEEARCRATLEQRAKLEAEQAESERLEKAAQLRAQQKEEKTRGRERARLEAEQAETRRLEQIAQLREQQEEEARCRASLEQQALLEMEQAETKRLEQEAKVKCFVAEAKARRAAEAERLAQELASRREISLYSELALTSDCLTTQILTPDVKSPNSFQQVATLDTPSTGHDHLSPSDASDASCGGGDQSSDCSNPRRRAGLQKKTISRKLRRPSSELEDVTGEWEKVQEDMANKSSDLDTLEKKVNSFLQLQCSSNPQQIGPPPGLELMSEAESNAAEVSALKQRVFQAMLKTKRSAGLERRSSFDLKKRVFQAMFSTKRSSSQSRDKESEMKTLQLKNLMKRAFRGMRDSKLSRDGHTTPRGKKSEDSPSESPSPDGSHQRDLQMLAEHVVEQLQTKADSIKAQIRNGFLRAHRAGELFELRNELDELADSVSQMGAKLGSGTKAELSPPCKKRWSAYTSGESEPEFDSTGRSPPPPSGFASDSDLESKRDRRWGSAASRTAAEQMRAEQVD